MTKTSVSVKALFRRLAQVEMMEAPAGEVGIFVQDEKGMMCSYVPVLSVYLDERPLFSGDQPAM